MGVSAKSFAMAACVVVGGWVGPALAADPAYVTIGAGSWEVLRDTARAAVFDLGFKPNVGWWIFRPQVGMMAASDGDYFGYAGFLADIPLGHFVLSPNAAVGGYGGHGYRLGSHVEFRTGGDFAWRFADASRLGVGFYHISNAGITERNPGSESLMLEYFYPLGR